MTQRVLIDGMSCEHCAMSVQEALNQIDGVSAVDVSLNEGAATVEAPSEIPTKAYSEAVAAAGYTFAGVE